MTILISFFFFQFQEKKGIGFFQLFFRFFLFLFHSIPRIPTPHSQHSHPESLHSPHSQHSHPHSPHSHPDSPHSHPDYPHSDHSSHSVPRFPIPAFTDSLLQILLRLKSRSARGAIPSSFYGHTYFALSTKWMSSPSRK